MKINIMSPRLACALLLLVSSCPHASESFHIGMTLRPHAGLGAAAAAAAVSNRRDMLFRVAGGLVVVGAALPSGATPVRAPLPQGKPDPADKEKLVNAANALRQVGGKLKDPAQWQSIAELVNKEPFEAQNMEKLFLRAAMNLPKSALLGTDAGIWSGVKVEAQQAMEAFSVEINYLNDQRAKGKGDQDSADLMTYYESAMGKIDEFLGLYTDEKTNKYLKAYGIKGGDE